MVVASGQAAVANANAQHSCEVGMCLKTVRTWWGISSRYPDAITAWREAKQQHPGDKNPPVGAPVFWAGGQYGHIAIYVGGPNMRSTDCTSSAKVSTAHGSWVKNTWGYDYLGWTGDLNGVDLPLDAGGSSDGSSEGDDDMPEYLSLTGPGFTLDPGGDWHPVKLDTESSDAGKVHEDSYAWLQLAGARYTGQLRLVDLERETEQTTIVVRFATYAIDSGKLVSAPAAAELPLTTGTTGVHAQVVGSCGKGNRVRAEVKARTGQVRVGSSGLSALYWR